MPYLCYRCSRGEPRDFEPQRGPVVCQFDVILVGVAEIKGQAPFDKSRDPGINRVHRVECRELD